MQDRERARERARRREETVAFAAVETLRDRQNVELLTAVASEQAQGKMASRNPCMQRLHAFKYTRARTMRFPSTGERERAIGNAGGDTSGR